jgi:subtilisin family serine protease
MLKQKICTAVLIAGFLFSAFPHPTTAEKSELKKLPLAKTEQKKSDYVDGEVIVKYKNGKKKKAALEKIRSFSDGKNLAIKDQFDDLDMAVLKSEKKSTADLLDDLKNDAAVEYAEPNYLRQLAHVPNDDYFSDQWAHRNTGQDVQGTSGTADADMDTSEMWDTENSGASDTIIAVLDDGADYSDSDMAANMWDGSASCKSNTGATISGGCPYHGWDYDDNDNDPFYQDHGGFIASVIASVTDNSDGIAGLSRFNHNKVMAVRFGLDVASEIKGINFAKNNGAKIINASFTGDYFSQSEKDAIDAFSGIVVAASGNGGADEIGDDVGIAPQYPCSYTSSNLICVGSSDQNDALSDFSNYSASSVDIVAPGENIIGLYDGTYYVGNGTSFATPYVAGTAGVLWSQDPSASTSTIKNTLLRSSDHKPGLSGKIACGRRLNADTALVNMQNSTVPEEICRSPLYRFANLTNGAYLYTLSESEKSYIIISLSSIWRYEGLKFYVYATQQTDTVPAYRFANLKNGAYLYTISESEKINIINNLADTWRYEGLKFYVYATQQTGTVPVYRFANLNNGAYLYTISESEKANIIANLSDIWRFEGTKYYTPTE